MEMTFLTDDVEFYHDWDVNPTAGCNPERTDVIPALSVAPSEKSAADGSARPL